MTRGVSHRVPRLERAPALEDGWEAAAWRDVEALAIDSFHPRSSGHRPVTRARLAHASDALYVIYRVDDRFVRCTYSDFQDPVYRDSCVELFVQPAPDRGYFGFEFNCAGVFLLSYIEDPRRTPEGFAKWTSVPAAFADEVSVRGSVSGPLEEEVREPMRWELSACIPLVVLEPFVGALAPLSGQRWRANLYKCADDSSHPHWASWAPIGPELNFHQPDRFRPIVFV